MKSITVTVADDGASANPIELAEFLYLFRAANVAAVLLGGHKGDETPSPTQISALKERIQSAPPGKVAEFLDPKTEPNVLSIEGITRNSPWEIYLYGSLCAITVAVVFSGGKIHMTPVSLKAELPPFGAGLERLRKALGLDKKVKAGFGIRELRIALTKEQFNLLMQPVVGEGGFQTYTRGLQLRINKQKRELILHEDDIERIRRYMSKPSAGGWQGKYKKTFGPYFSGESQPLLIEQ